ncbi:Gpi16 subunit, GPI transamidase component [Meredithblackwellia eburnea MCA 4105]
MVLLPLSLLLLVADFVSSSPLKNEYYNENLEITPLVDGKVHSAFNFEFNSKPIVPEPHQNSAVHSTVVPRLLVHLIQHHNLDSFSLTLSSGRWSPHWPSISHHTSAPSGIELQAWLKKGASGVNDEDLETDGGEDWDRRRWSRFKGAISGAFCAGIAQGKDEGDDFTRTASNLAQQEHPFRGEGLAEDHVIYTTRTPRLSATCTESLTPFIALLPCTSRAGIASLLNPHTLFDGDWTMIRIQASRQKDNSIRAMFQVGSVVDPVRGDRLRGGMGNRDFSMSSLYDRVIHMGCPVAQHSEVALNVPTDSLSSFEIQPEQGFQRLNSPDKVSWTTTFSSFSAQKPDSLNVLLKWSESQFRYPQPLPVLAPISARRILTGQGQERGEIGVELINHLDREVEVMWVERWPWWIRGFVGGVRSSSSVLSPENSTFSSQLEYSPPIARKRPTTLALNITLPPKTSKRIVLPYECSYLWYTEYPPDAHRGFEVPGAAFVILDENQEGTCPYRFHTPSTLLSLPTPDFSMPYNVIILTSTLMALFFGSIVNAMGRVWIVVDVRKDAAEKSEDAEALKG